MMKNVTTKRNSTVLLRRREIPEHSSRIYPVGTGVLCGFSFRLHTLGAVEHGGSGGRTPKARSEPRNRDVVLNGHFTMPVASRAL
ncbi:hypothetical protein VTH06DRAFT_1891 [Thermothelomyces fergusii]